jgi:beta-lactamase regulating signal transducer with metallopeptidase domain
MWFVTTFSHPLWQRLGLSLLHFLWQGLAVAALLGLALVLLRPRPGRQRYALFLAALIALAACPLVTFFTVDAPPRSALVGQAGHQADGLMLTDQQARASGPKIMSVEVADAGATLPAGSPTVAAAKATPQAGWSRLWLAAPQFLRSAIPWFVAFWLVGVLWLSVRLCVGLAAMRTLRGGLTPLPERLADRVGRIAERLGLAGFKSVFLSDTATDAMLTGFLKPMVLIPTAMLTQLSPDLIEAIVAHELAHLRRLDLWVNLFQNVVEALLFYHPAVWWISARVRA